MKRAILLVRMFGISMALIQLVGLPAEAIGLKRCIYKAQHFVFYAPAKVLPYVTMEYAYWLMYMATDRHDRTKYRAIRAISRAIEIGSVCAFEAADTADHEIECLDSGLEAWSDPTWYKLSNDKK